MIASTGTVNTQDKALGLASWKSATVSKSNLDLIVIGIDPPFSASFGALKEILSLSVGVPPNNALIASTDFSAAHASGLVALKSTAFKLVVGATIAANATSPTPLKNFLLSILFPLY